MPKTILAPGLLVRIALPPFHDRVLPIKFNFLGWEIFPKALYLTEDGTCGNLLLPTLDNLGAYYDLHSVEIEKMSCERLFSSSTILDLLEEARVNDTSCINFEDCFALLGESAKEDSLKAEIDLSDIPF